MNLKSLLSILMPLLLMGCGPDVLLPCEEGDAELSGLLCREYRYVNGSPIGYLEYAHRGDSAIDISTYDTQAILQKTSTERYSNGQLRTVVERFSNGSRVVRSYNYLSNDSLECLVFGAADSTEYFLYDEMGRRSRAERRTGETLTGAVDYRYFEDEDALYRITMRNGMDSILEYRNHEYFTDGRVRIEHFGADHAFKGYTLRQWTADGQLLTSYFTDPEMVTTERLEFIYDAQGRPTERIAKGTSGSDRSVFMYH